jgi:hypothetical protein
MKNTELRHKIDPSPLPSKTMTNLKTSKPLAVDLERRNLTDVNKPLTRLVPLQATPNSNSCKPQEDTQVNARTA